MAKEKGKKSVRSLGDSCELVLMKKMIEEDMVDDPALQYPSTSFVRPTMANLPRSSTRRSVQTVLTPSRKFKPSPKFENVNFAPSLRIEALDFKTEDFAEGSPKEETPKRRPGRPLNDSSLLDTPIAYSEEEQNVIDRVKELKSSKQWTSTKTPAPSTEPERQKAHWDFLLEEVVWMHKDFKNERHVRKLYQRKICHAVTKYHNHLKNSEEDSDRMIKEREKEARKACAFISKMIKEFWQKAEMIVDHGQKCEDDAKKRQALDDHLSLLVDEAELLSKSVNIEEDLNEEDQEKAQELNQLRTDANAHLDDLLSQLPKEYLEKYHLDNKDNISIDKVIDAVKDIKESVASPSKVNGNKAVEKRESSEVMDEDENKDIEAMEVDVADESKDSEVKVEEEKTKKERSDALDMIAAEAEEFQPKGNTLDTADVRIQHPVLIEGHLREYQLVGLQWLYALYEKNMNGILADEMGLGKTLQTISLFAHLAKEHSVWGPHLVVVPTSVIINWEMECKKWCPSLRVLTYFGNAKERAEKRKGWMSDRFDVCITSYKLYTQDVRCFKRKAWQYLVLDEAQHIKNFESQRWQSLINLRTKRRLLLTGTPLQNNLLELWSLLHFLMPRVFTSRDDFKDWFNNPITGMIEGSVDYNSKVVNRLHKVLRPFILRRLKSEVEKQMPKKTEEVILCDLSKRQRYLYNEFMSLRTTKDSLESGSIVSVLNIVMQLRKCCNHPNLFEPREVETPLCPEIHLQKFPYQFIDDKKDEVDENGVDLNVNEMEVNDDGMRILRSKGTGVQEFVPLLKPRRRPGRINMAFVKELAKEQQALLSKISIPPRPKVNNFSDLPLQRATITRRLAEWRNAKEIVYFNLDSMYQKNQIEEVDDVVDHIKHDWTKQSLKKFGLYVKEVVTESPTATKLFNGQPNSWHIKHKQDELTGFVDEVHQRRSSMEDQALVNSVMLFPEVRLIEYDCGKLQTLARLLSNLQENGHRVLIFTQMAKMLDILQSFLAYHGYVYFRLDGSTPVEKRQALMERFNTDTKVFCFILSTRAGGVGINLIGADTVIFYDSDWNPTMDAQAQDRCHRIGQTRDVTIYRLISKNTIEENILKKAREKRRLGEMTIDEGGFTPEFFKKTDNIRDLFYDNDKEVMDTVIQPANFVGTEQDLRMAMERAEDRQDVIAAKQVEAETAAEEIEFNENAAINYTDQTNAEFKQLLRDLAPIERYAVQFLSIDRPQQKPEVPELPSPAISEPPKANTPVVLKQMPQKRKAPAIPKGRNTIKTRRQSNLH